ncbi:MAG TPA: EF-P beta-lysylation protein EpmB [Aeromonadales bacterium]|nr:EF-P beta-lysylation protein EpmB [Aeromonadales bacterium]
MHNDAIIPFFSSGLQSESWQKQLTQGIKSKKQLLDYLELENSSIYAEIDASELFPTVVPLTFANKIKKTTPDDPLLLQVLASEREFIQAEGFVEDPLSEQTPQQNSSLHPLLHKYESRVLIVLTAACAINCRYCFRRHFPYRDYIPGQKGIDNIIHYLHKHPSVNEVILSGGEPLLVDDHYLSGLLKALCQQTEISRIRIHSRMLSVLPARITPTLHQLFATLPVPVILVTHINHGQEIDAELIKKFKELKSSNLTLLNQSVLLKDINDKSEVLVELSESLFKAGILPYYLHQLDAVAGAAHFNVTDSKARKLLKIMLEKLPGFLVPKLVREVSGFSSKIPLDLGIEPQNIKN